jgi:chromate reductase
MRIILAISGSLRQASSNTDLLRAAARFAPLRLYERLAEIPPFNPDVEESACPPVVTELRELVRAAEAVVICSPEYAHGVPGVLKNALDWLVGSDAGYGKRIAILNASSRSTFADASLRETVKTMGFAIVEEASVTIALDGMRLTVEEMVADPRIGNALRAAMAALRS